MTSPEAAVWKAEAHGIWSGGVKENIFSVCLEYNTGWVLYDRHESGQQKYGTLEKLLCGCVAEFNGNSLF